MAHTYSWYSRTFSHPHIGINPNWCEQGNSRHFLSCSLKGACVTSLTVGALQSRQKEFLCMHRSHIRWSETSSKCTATVSWCLLLKKWNRAYCFQKQNHSPLNKAVFLNCLTCLKYVTRTDDPKGYWCIRGSL